VLLDQSLALVLQPQRRRLALRRRLRLRRVALRVRALLLGGGARLRLLERVAGRGDQRVGFVRPPLLLDARARHDSTKLHLRALCAAANTALVRSFHSSRCCNAASNSRRRRVSCRANHKHDNSSQQNKGRVRPANNKAEAREPL